MSTQVYVCIALAMSAVVSTLAYPHENRVIRTVDLSDVVNKTVCPIKVQIDEDPNRLPTRIKMIKCAENSVHWCRVQRIPDHECCFHDHNNHVMDCVEMRDTVLVFYKGSKEPSAYEVSVGCTCMIGDSTTAPDVPSGPT